MGWLSAGEAYEVSLVAGKVVARSAGPRASGRPLKSLPKVLRDHPEVDRLRQLAEWLDGHEAPPGTTTRPSPDNWDDPVA